MSFLSACLLLHHLRMARAIATKFFMLMGHWSTFLASEFLKILTFKMFFCEVLIPFLGIL